MTSLSIHFNDHTDSFLMPWASFLVKVRLITLDRPSSINLGDPITKAHTLGEPRRPLVSLGPFLLLLFLSQSQTISNAIICQGA